MKLVSVNRATAQYVRYNDRTVRTGIFKSPSSSSVLITKQGLVADEQVDQVHHGGLERAVYAFSFDHYAYWQEQLNKDIAIGSFGENLTISGFSETEIHIGDQFQVNNCILEVSQPRVPCFKLGIALEDPTAPKKFSQSCKTGAYLRVLKEGSITGGAIVKKLYRVPDSVSLFSIYRAIFDSTFEEAEKVLSAAHKLDALSTDWKNKIEARLYA